MSMNILIVEDGTLIRERLLDVFAVLLATKSPRRGHPELRHGMCQWCLAKIGDARFYLSDGNAINRISQMNILAA